MMKKALSWLLALTLLVGMLPTLALATSGTEEVLEDEDWSDFDDDDFSDFDDDDFSDFDDDEDEDGGDDLPAGYYYTGPAYEYDHLVVGNPTALSGNFTTQMWGYNTSDVDVTALVNGCNLIAWHFDEGNFQEDTSVVSGLMVYTDDEGNRTYMLALQSDLFWSDGTPITAADYAFSILLSASPAVRALGGDTQNYSCIEGMEAYREGTTNVLSGLRVVNDQMLNITVSAEYLPFFYELGMLWCYPMPIHVIAPGCRVVSGDEGSRIEGDFTAELLAETMLNEDTGYVSHPSVVSGPYRLVSYDAVTNIVEFEINEYYKGNEEGVLPSIQRLTLRPVANDTMIEELSLGEIGLINKVVNTEAIMKGVQLIATQNYAMSTYARTGQSYISFNCEQPAVSSQAVRQAIAYCLDKDETVTHYTGYYGLRVDGYYGIAQWMYQVMTGAMAAPVAELDENATAAEEAAYEAELEAWAALNMDEVPRYDLDVDAAIRLLEQDGWTLNADGSAYTAADAYRCKEIDGNLVALNLTLAVPQETSIARVLEDTFLPHLAEAGIQVMIQPMEWQALLRQYYRQDARTCEMMYLASNFNAVFDPWPTFDPADAETGLANYTGIQDEALYLAARDMCQTEPGDNLTYETKWLAFQKRYQEVVPAIPVYGNAYFDFYTRYLKDYTVGNEITWTDAILSSYMSDPGVAPEEEDEGAEEDDLEGDFETFE